MSNSETDLTPWLYSGRVGHDVSEGHCSCGSYHCPEDQIEVGTKSVLVSVDGELKTIKWREPVQGYRDRPLQGQ